MKKPIFAGGYNGGRYSVTGYELGPNNYYIKSSNSIVMNVVPVDAENKKDELKFFNVSIYRNNEFLFNYIHDLAKSRGGNSRPYKYELIDSIAVNILFQLNELELDRLLPMIIDAKDHSFSLNSKISTYYIHCDSGQSSLSEFIIHEFIGKFFFDECSLYRKSRSMNNILRKYSHFTDHSLLHSLSDDDAYITLSSFNSTWLMYFDSAKNVNNYMIDYKNSMTGDMTFEAKIVAVKGSDDFYDQAFNMIIKHIISAEFITNGMSAIIEDYGIEMQKDWKGFVKLIDMATI